MSPEPSSRAPRSTWGTSAAVSWWPGTPMQQGVLPAALPAGKYKVTVAAAGFRSEVIEELDVDVGRTLVHDFHLAAGGRTKQ